MSQTTEPTDPTQPTQPTQPKQTVQEKYENRQQIIRDNENRLPIEVHPVDLTNKQVKYTDPQYPYN